MTFILSVLFVSVCSTIMLIFLMDAMLHECGHSLRSIVDMSEEESKMLAKTIAAKATMSVRFVYLALMLLSAPIIAPTFIVCMILTEGRDAR